MDPGLAGGIAGGVGGLLGAAIGSYCCVAGTRGPRERALAIRITIFAWLWMGGLMAWLFLMPRPWSQAAILLSLPLLLSIPRGNRMLARARAEDDAQADEESE